MKKHTAFFCTLIFVMAAIVPPLWGQNFGFVLDNATDYIQDINPENNVFNFLQKDKLTFWGEHYLSGRLKIYLQGNYTFSTDQYLLFDLDYFSIRNEVGFSEEGAGMSSWQAGRFMLNEFSGNVYAHRLDGFLLDLKFPAVHVRLAAGYTGLFLKDASELILSNTDLSNANKSEVFFGAPRFVGLLQFAFPELFNRMDFSVSVLAQQDLWDSQNLAAEGDTVKVPGQGGKLNTQYLGVGLSGPIVVPFYFEAFAYLGTGTTLSYVFDEATGISSYKNMFLLSGLGGVSARLYLEEQLYQTLVLDLLFATGDNDYTASFYEGNTASFANTFVPITNRKLGLVFSPALGNLALVQFSYSLKPFSKLNASGWENLQTLTKALVFFRTSRGLISESGINPDSDALYLGTEADLILNYRPLSDLGVALSWGFFFPYNSAGTGAFLPTEKSFKLRGLLEVSLAF